MRTRRVADHERWERCLTLHGGTRRYLFKPRLAGMVLYVKLIVRSNCVLISFHEDEGDLHEEENV